MARTVYMCNQCEFMTAAPQERHMPIREGKGASCFYDCPGEFRKFDVLLHRSAMIVLLAQDGVGAEKATCPDCDGSGRTPEKAEFFETDICQTCLGDGWISKDELYHIQGLDALGDL